MSPEHPLDGLLDTMFPAALQFVGAVRARDPEWVTSLTQDLTREQVMALLVTVAAMVPDDVHTDQLLLWTHGPAVQDQVYGQAVVVELGGGKECTRCGQVLPLEEFYPDPKPNNPDRRKSRCKACISEVVRDRKAARDAVRAAAAPVTAGAGEAVKAA